ncbi:MAG: response regulator [Treponema sp.]|jgi:signal transduction histidine kinase|nr:response regulator [Treponema sp.]
MLKDVSLKTKIFFMVSTVVIVSFLTLTLVVSNRTFDMARKDAFNLAQETADKYRYQIMAELQGARITAETLATVFETLKDHNLTDRTMMNAILRNALMKKEYITAFCIAYDPDALDGKDAEYAGLQPTYDETGRFAPYWNKLGGNIAVEPLYDIDIADWYVVPKATRHEYITDPYPYQVQGNEVMLASLIFPILHNDEFIGIISSDIVLDKLQEMISNVNPHGQGGYTQIFTNTGTVVAHPDKLYLGKDLAESLVYDMMAADPSGKLDLSQLDQETSLAILQADPAMLRYVTEAKDAIRNGETYIASGKDSYRVYFPIKFSAITRPWSVAVSIPMTRVLDNALGIRNYVILVSVIAICVIMLVLYFIARNITRPILTLSDTAKILGEGNFDTEVPLIQSNDEIGTLAKAFRFMAEKINHLIKEMQEYAKSLESAMKEAMAANKAKTLFLANMSHEMRTPMNAIIGMTAIGKSASGAKKKNYAFGKIEDASTHLLGVINDILDMSKIEADKFELSAAEFNFEKMLQKVVNVINFRIDEKKQHFTVHIDNNIPRILNGDDQRLAQVITNLLSNAVKFTPEFGSISLDTRFLKEENGLCTIQTEVADTGIGISEEQQSRLFTSFEQAERSTSRKFGGTGLGLAISKRIVEMMGGTILIKSEPGKGSVFTFTVQIERGVETDADAPVFSAEGAAASVLPESDSLRDTDTFQPDTGAGDAAEHSASAEMPQADNFRCRRVLLVEDVEINREIVLELLEPTGLEIDCAENGTEALRKFSEAPDKYDMIFMDVQMPEMDGYEATRKIREFETEKNQRKADVEFPQGIPIVAMTANVFREDIERCLETGMNDHIGKPLNFEEVLVKLRKYLPELGSNRV